jgi:hypothetical protein
MSDPVQPSSSQLGVIQAERLRVFGAIMTRCRWFLLIAVFISLLMSIHVFLEQYSYQKCQDRRTLAITLADVGPTYLAGVMSAPDSKNPLHLVWSASGTERNGVARVFNVTPGSAYVQKVKQFADAVAAEAVQKDEMTTKAKNEAAEQVIETAWQRLQFWNRLEKSATDDRSIPLLGISVAPSDYLIVMAPMLVVFVVGLWLNIRSLRAASAAMRSDSVLRELTRLNFTFTGLTEPGNGATMARIVQFASIWAPFLLLLWAAGIDIRTFWHQLVERDDMSSGVAGTAESMVLRLVVFVVVASIVLAATIASHRAVSEIDRE